MEKFLKMINSAWRFMESGEENYLQTQFKLKFSKNSTKQERFTALNIIYTDLNRAIKRADELFIEAHKHKENMLAFADRLDNYNKLLYFDEIISAVKKYIIISNHLASFQKCLINLLKNYNSFAEAMDLGKNNIEEVLKKINPFLDYLQKLEGLELKDTEQENYYLKKTEDLDFSKLDELKSEVYEEFKTLNFNQLCEIESVIRKADEKRSVFYDKSWRIELLKQKTNHLAFVFSCFLCELIDLQQIKKKEFFNVLTVKIDNE